MAVQEKTAAAAEPADDEPFEHHGVGILALLVSEERVSGGAGIGIAYDYRFDRRWGGGVYAEDVAGDFDAAVFGVMANLRATERLMIDFGPGVETTEEETRALLRVGGLYEIDLGDFFVGPAVYWDWLEDGEHAFVFGLVFGKMF